ncbi:MAG: right-handed parallel beta-helix repeat-containing protein, partial [Lentisphaeria bacterium]|nr:right-handed parallel beta-helix repeat-containing protein [Lentisphaeria bacterium]
MKRLFLVTLLFVCFGICAGELHFEPLFHSSSVYFRSEKVRQCRIFYREKGSQEWLETFEPQFDSTAPAQYRTSIVNLKENTEYEVQVQIRVGTRNRINAKGTFRTWADRVPIAKTIVLTPEQVKNGYAIRNVKGKADGWIRYTTKPGTVVRAKKGVRQALLVDRCEYVIVENMVIRGGDTHGVVLDHCKYVRLRNLDISNWFNPEGWWFEKKNGRIRNARYKHLYSHNGIDIRFGYGQVIERCYIHDPALTSNEWRYGHPDGPQGIGPCKPRSTVIRYNDICGSDLKWWNDGIAGPYNFDADGGLNRDCDVYGNYIAFANDDGIELDGGQ